MRVEQNNFRDMLTGYLSGPPQTQHVFCVFPATRVTHTCLAGEEWLKAFPLQAFQYGDGGNVRIAFTAGSMPVFTENTGNIGKRAARTVLTGMCYSVGSATRQGSSSPTRFIGQSAMTSRT